jgi:murein L,D-transpeptidase YcbB/YkuD
MKMKAKSPTARKSGHQVHSEKQDYRPYIFVFLLGVALTLGLSIGSKAAVQDAQPSRGEAPAPANIAPSSDNSSVWRPFIWEAIPGEYLTDPRRSIILGAYQQNGWKPIFIDRRLELGKHGRALIQLLQNLKSDAIDPGPYHLEALQHTIDHLDRLRQSLEASNPYFYDNLSVVLDDSSRDPSVPRKAASPTQYAANSPVLPAPEHKAQHVDRQKIKDILQAASRTDTQLAVRLVRYARDMDPFSHDYQVKVLSGEMQFDEFFKLIASVSPRYAVLREALKRYEELASGPAQPILNDPATLRPGDRGNSVVVLQKRLQQEGFYTGKADGSFDAATLAAVKDFQHAHLQVPDGAVGPRTRDWLNVPYAKKAEMITWSLKALRQSESRRFSRYIWINIPQFMLEYYNDNKVESANRVIIGKASGKKIKFQGHIIGENHTPSLTSTIEGIDFNPRWYVSDRIRKELSDVIAADPNYLTKNGYVQMSSLYPSGEPRIFQLPGPNNPMGHVKFDFQNAYAIFLHDTPNKYLFQRSRRDFSHGCIRMEGAPGLAELLLREDDNPASGKVASYLKNNRPVSVKLQHPIPIVIDYVPVSSDEQNKLLFCGDLYGRFGE